MADQRPARIGRWPWLVLAAGLGASGWGWLTRGEVRTFDAAAAALVDGAVERAARTACLETVRREGPRVARERASAAPAVQAAMAALLLGDETGCRALLAELPAWPAKATGCAGSNELALGRTHLVRLLEALGAERSPERAGAEAAFARARSAARLEGDPLAERLAAEGFARVTSTAR